MNGLRQISGRGVVVAGNDIDTDRIIPARFLRCVTFDGLGKALFYDERFKADGTPVTHPLNAPGAVGAEVMLSGLNFGCGSSREHAPQSLKRAGFKLILAESFAEIFFGNALTLGIVCATMPKEGLAELRTSVNEAQDQAVSLDIETETVSHRDETWACSIEPKAKEAFLGGSWDPLDGLLSNAQHVARKYQQMPYRQWEQS